MGRGDGRVRTRTGASVVAVIRDDRSIPGPGPEPQFLAGDVALLIGSVDGVQAAVSGLALGEGGPAPLSASSEFVRIEADLGVVMLLLLLGLEYTSADLQHGVRSNWLGGVVDLVANAAPGAIFGVALGW